MSAETDLSRPLSDLGILSPETYTQDWALEVVWANASPRERHMLFPGGPEEGRLTASKDLHPEYPGFVVEGEDGQVIGRVVRTQRAGFLFLRETWPPDW